MRLNTPVFEALIWSLSNGYKKKCFIVISVAPASVMPVWCSYNWAARISGKLGCLTLQRFLYELPCFHCNYYYSVIITLSMAWVLLIMSLFLHYLSVWLVVIDDDILQAEVLGERGKPPLVANSVPTLFQYNNFKSDSKRVLSEQRRIRKEKEEVR